MFFDLLSLDLGITTGFWAFPDVDEEWVCGEWAFDSYRDSLQRFVRLYGEPLNIVAEKPQILYPGQLQQKLHQVIVDTQVLCDHVHFTTPSQWKQSHGRIPVPKVNNTSAHMKDAYRMGVWY